MSNSLDPDQTRPFVAPDLGGSLLADNTSRQRVKVVNSYNTGLKPFIIMSHFVGKTVSTRC